MGKRIDMAGKKYGKLTVIKYAYTNNDKKAVWECICECGKIHYVGGKELRSGRTKSCGCGKKERISMLKYKDGRTKERLYQIWGTMIKRCKNANCRSYSYYGSRGITVCDEWLDYSTFRIWALNNGFDEYAPRGECTIDRIDNDAGYNPANCRIVDMHIQNKNKRYFPEHHPRDSKTGRFLKVGR